MIFLEIKLARHGESSALVANSGLRGYNIVKTQIANGSQIVCTEKDFDLTKAEFMYPVMVNGEIAREAFSFI
jgi:hypothetical protein